MEVTGKQEYVFNCELKAQLMFDHLQNMEADLNEPDLGTVVHIGFMRSNLQELVNVVRFLWPRNKIKSIPTQYVFQSQRQPVTRQVLRGFLSMVNVI